MSTAELPAADVSGPSETPAHPVRARPKKRRTHVEHKIPGRIRMKVPSARGNPEVLAAYQEALLLLPGVTTVKARIETGSLVIHYDVAREHEFEHHFNQVHQSADAHARAGDEIAELASKIEAEAEFLAGHSEIAKTTVQFFKRVDHELRASTGNTIDLKIVLAAGLTVYTFVEIGAHAATPMWVTLALFTVHHFAELHAGSAHPTQALAPVRA